MQSSRSIIYLIIGMILFGSATPVSRIIAQDLGTFTASSLRVVLGTLFLLPFSIKSLPQIGQLNRSQWWQISMISLFGMVGFTALLIEGMGRVAGVVGSVIMATVPVITAIGARLFFKSKFTKLKVIAIILATMGALSLHFFRGSFTFDSESGFYLGVLLVFGAVCCEAAYTLIGKKATNSMDPILVTVLATALSIPLFIILSFTEQDSWHKLSELNLRVWMAIIWWGGGTLALGAALWYEGVSKAKAGTAPAFMGLMPLSALILSYVLLGEPFHWPHLIGFGLVFLAVLLMSRVHMKEGH